ncbi:MAG: MATE family multidrug resistance protein, partial [Verrucomicrobiales bacterium]
MSARNLRKSHASPGKLLKASYPLIISQSTLAVMQMTDLLLLSNLGGDVIAAISPAGMLLLVLSQFGSGYIEAGMAFISQSYGGEHFARCIRYTFQAVYFSVALGVTMLATWFMAPSLIGVIELDLPVFEIAVDYFQVSVFSLSALFVSASLEAFFLGAGRPKITMFTSLVTMTVNIPLSYCLINGALGLPMMGATGAALGTLLAALLNTLLLVVLFVSSTRHRAYFRSAWRFDRLIQKRMASVGIASGIQCTIDVFSWGVLLIALISRFGMPHLTAGTVMLRCMHLSFLPVDGIARTLNSFTGQAIGAGRYRLACSQVSAVAKISTVYMGAMALLFLLFRQQIMEFFSDDPLVIQIGSTAMIFVALFQIFDALNITYVNALQGAGDTVWASMANLILSLVILLGGGLLVSYLRPEWGSSGV